MIFYRYQIGVFTLQIESVPRKASDRTSASTLTARLVMEKVTTWIFSWMVSGWRESREKRRKRRKLML